MTTQRIHYIDTLRGFAIFLVTLGHVLEECGYRGMPLFQFIYSFHMPLFFCISGFVMSLSFERKMQSNNKITIKKVTKFIYAKFKGIMVPYYAWSLLALPLFFYCYNGTLNYRNTLNAVFVTNTSFWFLPCLFGLSIVYILYKFALNKVNLKYRNNAIPKVLACMLLATVLFALYYYTKYDFIRSIMSYILPFFIGVFMSEYKKINELICDNTYIYTLSFIAFCLTVGLFISPPNGIVEKASRLVCGLLSIPVLFNFFKNTNIHPGLKNIMEYTGRNTLIIYILQFRFIQLLPNIPDLNIFMQVCILSAISILLIAFILLISMFFEKSTYTSLIFLGKKQ